MVRHQHHSIDCDSAAMLKTNERKWPRQSEHRISFVQGKLEGFQLSHLVASWLAMQMPSYTAEKHHAIVIHLLPTWSGIGGLKPASDMLGKWAIGHLQWPGVSGVPHCQACRPSGFRRDFNLSPRYSRSSLAARRSGKKANTWSLTCRLFCQVQLPWAPQH